MSRPVKEFARALEKELPPIPREDPTVVAYEEEHGCAPGYLREQGTLEDHPLFPAVAAARSRLLTRFPDADLLAFEHWYGQRGGSNRLLWRAEAWSAIYGLGDPTEALAVFLRLPPCGIQVYRWIYDWLLCHGSEEVLCRLQEAGERSLKRPHPLNDDHRYAVRAAYYRFARGTLSEQETIAVLRRQAYWSPQPPEPAAIVRPFMELLARLLDSQWDEKWIHSYLETPFKGFNVFPGKALFLAAMRRLATVKRLSRATSSVSSASTLWSILHRSYPQSRSELDEVVPVLETLPEEALLQALVTALPWAPAIERVIGWPGAAEAVAWGYAHTRCWVDDWFDDGLKRLREMKQAWVESIGRCRLEETFEGIAARARLLEIEGTLGRERLIRLAERFGLVSERPQADEARQFALAVLGANREEVFTRFPKRTPWVVKALGMLPGEDVAARYAMIQEFKKGSRQFGMARRASEKRMAEVALENLARTAGFNDAFLFALHVEPSAETSCEWRTGGHVLRIEVAEGRPVLSCREGEKDLRSVPAAIKKSEAYVEARERADRLKVQSARLRGWLEAAMVDGRELRGSDLARLWEHPVGIESVRNLILRVNGTDLLPEQGRPFRDGDTVTVPHALDLDQRGTRPALQRRLLLLERAQPFKQLFREVYAVSADETAASESRRFAGHVVHSARACSLLGSRGWRFDPEWGMTRENRPARLRVLLEFEELVHFASELPTLTTAAVRFRRDASEVRCGEVPPRYYSETLRDVDLAVSVAAARGEAPWSPESAHMMGVLVEELAEGLKLANVRIVDPFAEVRGARGRYRVHLGSGVVHRDPGRNLVLTDAMLAKTPLPRLPLYDPDPRTLEIVAKVLLLARDEGIRDAATLEAIG